MICVFDGITCPIVTVIVFIINFIYIFDTVNDVIRCYSKVVFVYSLLCLFSQEVQCRFTILTLNQLIIRQNVESKLIQHCYNSVFHCNTSDTFLYWKHMFDVS